MKSLANLFNSFTRFRTVINNPCWRHITLLRSNKCKLCDVILIIQKAKWRSGCTMWHSFFTMCTNSSYYKQINYLPSFSPPSSKGSRSPSSSGSWVGRISGATTIGRLPSSPSSPGLTVLAPSPRSGAVSGISVNKNVKVRTISKCQKQKLLAKTLKNYLKIMKHSLAATVHQLWWLVIIFR